MASFKVVEPGSSYFPVDSTGRKVYYPWGIFGYGYYLDTPLQEEQVLKNWTRWFLTVFSVSIILMVVCVIRFKIPLYIGVIGTFFLYCILLYFRIKKVTVGLTPCKTRMSPKLLAQYCAGRFTLPFLIFMEVGNIYMAGIGWLDPFEYQNSHLNGLFFSVLFSVSVIFCAYVLMIKMGDRKK